MLSDIVTLLNDLVSDFWTVVAFVSAFWVLVFLGSMLRFGSRAEALSENTVRHYRLPGRGSRGD